MSQTPYKALGQAEKKKRLLEITRVFLKLGLVAFGGPAAHIAMLEEEAVNKRNWLTREDFLDLLSATNLIPGPNSTEMAIHVGFLRGGVWGLLLAGLCFILPAMMIVLIFASLYAAHGQVREVEGLLYGMKPVILAVIIQALLRLSKSVLKSLLPGLVAGVVVVLYFLGLPEIPLLIVAGVWVMMIKNWDKIKPRLFSLPLLPPLFLAQALPPAQEAVHSLGNTSIFLIFLKIGSFLYGSGYVLLAFLEREFVTGLAVLSHQQLLDAVAVGQFTPGPVFTTATFIGFLLNGYPGALFATLGIFLPSFLLVYFLNPLIPRMRKSSWLGAALDGVNAGSLALMAAVSVKLGISAVMDVFTLALMGISLFLMVRFKVNSFWLILLGGLAGLLVKAFF